ncbi:MAG: mucoidy inhibitor MuiA family protein [Sandaracinaceae bacterium]|nr:mucoidy inhibitor MuiA family protein [Sandaracinaceae bacterium]
MSVEATIPVDEVTLMEDRARVIRRGVVELPAGRTRLVIEGVSPVLSDKTLAARSSSAKIDDASVARRRLHLPEERREAHRELLAREEALTEALEGHRERLARVEESLGLLATAADRTVEEIAVDAAWSRADVDAWKRRLATVDELEARLREERLQARRDARDVERERDRVRTRRQETERTSDELVATITVAVEVDEAGAHPIEIEYVVPNACWRPQHRATLEDGRLRFESEGCVWQNTGEDWDDVQLRFSTQRPSLGAEPPRLATDRLAVRRKADRIVVEQRQQVVEQTGLGRAIASAPPELPGIDDGGEVQELVAAHRTRVVSDGRPHRAPLFAFEADAHESLTCAPELAAAVLRKTEQVNAAARPVLAGPVELVRGGGVVGRTSTLFVAPDERFELGWGPDPALRVHRETEETEEESKMLSSWFRSTRKIVDKLSNLGPEPKVVELVERVPVSEIEKLEIEVDVEATGRAADGDGFVRWTLELAPFGRERAELRYVVSRHSDVSGTF